ncbi:unnamed protein product [Urochloa humidicola]
MDVKVTAILFALFLACLLSPTKCKADIDEGKRWTGGLKRQPDSTGTMLGSSKIFVILCFKDYCGGPEYVICYCCQTLPGRPCYSKQHDCWNVCRPRRVNPSHPYSLDAPSSAGRQHVPMGATSKSPSPGGNS